MIRAIRGAVNVRENTREAILEATRLLLKRILDENRIVAGDVASIFFTATVDLDADYPAHVVRELGWKHVAILCAQEMEVPGSMSMVIRALVHVNSSLGQNEMKHQYLGETASLRPDLFDRS